MERKREKEGLRTIGRNGDSSKIAIRRNLDLSKSQMVQSKGPFYKPRIAQKKSACPPLFGLKHLEHVGLWFPSPHFHILAISLLWRKNYKNLVLNCTFPHSSVKLFFIYSFLLPVGEFCSNTAQILDLLLTTC